MTTTLRRVARENTALQREYDVVACPAPSGDIYYLGQTAPAHLGRATAANAHVWGYVVGESTALEYPTYATNGSQIACAYRRNFTNLAIFSVSSSGSLTWQRNTTATASPERIAVDASGNVYVAWGDTNLLYVSKHNASDGTTAWSRSLDFSGATGATATDLKITSDGNVAVAIFYNNSGDKSCIARLNASDGTSSWVREVVQVTAAQKLKIACDGSANILYAGTEYGDDQILHAGRFTSGGTLDWSREYVLPTVSGATYFNELLGAQWVNSRLVAMSFYEVTFTGLFVTNIDPSTDDGECSNYSTSFYMTSDRWRAGQPIGSNAVFSSYAFEPGFTSGEFSTVYSDDLDSAGDAAYTIPRAPNSGADPVVTRATSVLTDGASAYSSSTLSPTNAAGGITSSAITSVSLTDFDTYYSETTTLLIEEYAESGGTVCDATGFLVGNFGLPAAYQPTDETVYPSGFLSTAYGTPKTQQYYRTNPIWTTTEFGTPSTPHALTLTAAGFVPIRFGTGFAYIATISSENSFSVADGFLSTTFGTPNVGGLTAGGAAGFVSTAYGTPRVQLVQGASGFVPATFGTPTAADVLRAAGFSSTTFGTAIARRTAYPAAVTPSILFGLAKASFPNAYAARPVRRSVLPQFGRASARQGIFRTTTGWSAAQFGTPAGTTTNRATCVPPSTLLGTPTIQRSHTC